MTHYLKELNKDHEVRRFGECQKCLKVVRLSNDLESVCEGGRLRVYGSCLTCGERVKSSRRIFYKFNPSMHKCDARCLGGRAGGDCQCECGGFNHGKSEAKK